jgi:N-acyl homoserine lactone hydrolase
MGVKKIYLLQGGFVTADRSILLTAVDIGQKIQAPIFSVLLMHDEGPILIDTGLIPEGLTKPEEAWGPRAKVIRPQLTEADDIRNRLKELGLQPADVRMVILTHMHWDHTGGLRFFPHCPGVVQKSEHRFAYEPDSFVAAQYMQNHISFPLKFQLAEGDQSLLPGVSVVKTPGHTPGHQSILVRLETGKSYLFAGDVISLADNLKLKIPGSNTWNAQQSVESLYKLEHLSGVLDADIIPSHDMGKWSEWKKSPEPFS